MSSKQWILVCYDIRDPKRWREVHQKLLGRGERVQYSIFRCYLNPRQMEELRWELERELAPEDDLIFIQLSAQCRVIERPDRTWLDWHAPLERHRVF